MTTYTKIDQQLDNVRLDQALARLFDGFSRSYFEHLIENEYVLVNGVHKKKREKVKAGDEIEIEFVYSDELKLEPENIPLDVLYEDDDIIAINKSNDMVVHPAPGNPKGTLVSALLFRLKSLPLIDNAPLRPGIVHRLDKETSGVILVAKTERAHWKLGELFQNRLMEKTYIAVCIGNVKDQKITLPIGRHPTKRKEMAIVESGKAAETTIINLKTNGAFSLVEARPRTGRTHQIRVHLKAVGHPILGDSVYGSKSLNEELSEAKQLLHAYKISFIHPFLNTPICIQAPLPNAITSWQQKL
ncbi:MAG: RluA family pseudouridine synthase [Chlamydiae bacterium]|nr:RluA family pseudouridine synthase [Chlamydiota bacterium]